jgi:hypothetical protein
MAKKAKKKEWVLQAAIFSMLRRGFRTFPPYKETLDEAKEVYFIKSKKGKQLRRVRFRCTTCKQKFARANIVVDHVEPVISVTGVAQQLNGQPDFNKYIDRLYCAKSNLQAICKTCHTAKSNAENKLRREAKKPKTTTKPTRKGSK